jgi:hypothetical protein
VKQETYLDRSLGRWAENLDIGAKSNLSRSNHI